MMSNPDKSTFLPAGPTTTPAPTTSTCDSARTVPKALPKLLVKTGVAENQLTVTTNNGNLSDLGEKCVALDRAVTIEEAK